uniref:Aminopeptidase N n=1 Tax=Ditylenchus dipsaci TaxID=166011 RepID=A0A915D487_9BILA
MPEASRFSLSDGSEAATTIRTPVSYSNTNKFFGPSALFASLLKKLKIVSDTDKLATAASIHHYANPASSISSGSGSNVSSAANLEEIDLSDRRSLIPMTELHSNSPKDANQSSKYNPLSNGNASNLPQQSLPKMSGGAAKVADGSAASLSNAESGANRPVSPANKNMFQTQVLLTVIFVLASILASVLITYVVTKDTMHRGGAHQESDAQARAQAGLDSTTNGYDDELEKCSVFLLPILNIDEQDDGPPAAALRLSEDFLPLWYNLSMKVYVPGFVHIPPEKRLSFDAALILKFRVRNPTKVIELNSLNVSVNRRLRRDPQESSTSSPEQSSSSSVSESTKELRLKAVETSSVSSSELDNDNINNDSNNSDAPKRVPAAVKVIKVTANETLEKVFFELDDPYSGPIAKKLSGLYLTQYTTLEGKKKYAAVSQMEPTDARRVVPCFDEPAVWRLRVIHPVGSKAVSNAIELTEDEPTSHPDWILTTFDETLPMSSYLLALVVSDFEYVERRTNKNTRFRIWARSDAVNLTSYALSAGIKVLEYYEDYYGIPFPLPKQDMMAFPDFAAGAMENWGLVTYREKYLLYSPDLYTSQQQMAVSSVVSHELATR